MLSAVIIGARRVRQGLGPFIAAALHAEGVCIAGVVGTRPESVAAACTALREQHGIDPRAYTSVERALAAERPDLVAICSPIESHRDHLEVVAAAGAHCLAEKPLCWQDGIDLQAVTAGIADGFRRQGRLLDLVTQWPMTLPAYDRLHPGRESAPIERFEMWLSPIVKGPRMVLDSASHILSLLEALAGPGEVEDARAVFEAVDRSRVRLTFGFAHAGGTVAASLRLAEHAEAPRPAGYAVNGRPAERRIDLPAYRIYFEAEGRRAEVEDPVALLVRDFVSRVRAGAATDRDGLVRGIRGLARLMRVAETAATAPTTD